MADVAENLREFLLTDGSISAAVGTNRISQTHVPQEFEGTFIWFTSSGSEKERCLGEGVGTAPFRYTFDLECVGETIGAVDTLGDLVVTKLDMATGSFGGQQVQCVFCDEQGDDYVPRAIDADSGLCVRAYKVEVVPR